MTDLTVANTILQQLGGRRFRAMTGAKDFVSSDDALSFTLPRGMAKDGINRVKVTLTPADLYHVEFYRYAPRKRTLEARGEFSNVFCDQLRTVFEDRTGLLTAL